MIIKDYDISPFDTRSQGTIITQWENREGTMACLVITESDYAYWSVAEIPSNDWDTPELGRWLSRDPIEEKGGWNLNEMVGNDSVNLIDWLGMEGKKGICQCCCVENISVRNIKFPWVGETLQSGYELYFDVTQKMIDTGNIIIDQPGCSFTWVEKSNRDVTGMPGDNEPHDRTKEIIAKLKDDTETNGRWEPMKEGEPIIDAFKDKPKWTFTKEYAGNVDRTAFSWTLWIHVTVFSSKDDKCKKLKICSKDKSSALIVVTMKWGPGMSAPSLGIGY